MYVAAIQKWKPCLLQWLYFGIIICSNIGDGEQTDKVILTQNSTLVLEHTSLTMNCSYYLLEDNLLLSFIRYQNDSNKYSEVLSVLLGKNLSSLQGNSSTYTFEYSQGETYAILTELDVTRDDHNTTWYCKALPKDAKHEYKSREVTISVAVPVKHVTINFNGDEQRITTIENIMTNITCVASFAYPPSNIFWYKFSQNALTPPQNITHNAKTKTIENVQQSYLMSTESELKFYPSRNDTRSVVYCSARNVDGQSLVNSSKLELKVQYPPTKPVLSIDSVNVTGKVTIIQGNRRDIRCKSLSDPLPEYKWIFKSDQINGSVLEISSNISFVKRTYTCKAINSMRSANNGYEEGRNEVSVSLSILVPPAKPVLRFRNPSGPVIQTHVLDVIRGDDVTIVCEATGKPKPHYKWTGMDTANDTLTLISTTLNSNHTCFARSLLTETVGEVRNVTTSSTVSINILYPPKAPVIHFHLHPESQATGLNDFTVVENDSFTLKCTAESEPLPSVYKWSGPKISSTSLLEVKNAIRKNAGWYTCDVSNVMNRSFVGPEEGTNSSKVLITVLYAAKTEDFYIQGQETKADVEINQMDKVIFHCNVDSKPDATVNITFNGKPIKTNVNTINVTHIITEASCENAGIYYCSSANKYNYGKNSERYIKLYVKCYPRPRRDLLHQNVTSRKYTSATLSFTAQDFLEVDTTIFQWQRHKNESSWEVIENKDNKSNVSTARLQSNLTIINVTESDFGKYRVIYNNSAGGNEQVFQLYATDVPDPPYNFNYSDDSLTQTSVTVTWTKGFNGGFRQTFILKYNQTSFTVLSISVKESSSSTFNHTIQDLSSDTLYKLQLWTKNIVGTCNVSRILFIKTKEATMEQSVTKAKSYSFGGLVGGVCAGFVVIIGIAFGILYYRRRNDRESAKMIYQNVPFSGNHQTMKRCDKENIIEETPFEGLQEVDDVPFVKNEPTEYCNSPEKIQMIDRIQLSELISYVLAKSEESFSVEYQKLPTELQRSCIFARRPENLPLNRYNGIYPYDHSRVQVNGIPDFFINACYIDGYRRSKTYIASLGPTEKTTRAFNTFWQMVWYEKSDIIVMLTNLREPSGMKCEQYWPEKGTSECFGDVSITGQKTDVFAEYTVRTFSVSKDEERRFLTHLHYTAWPDKKVPEDATTLIEFRQRMKATPTYRNGPIIVHCSAGIGRTGTFIALDRLIEEGQSEDSVNVYECVKSMREQRVKMVQTAEQYIYIHKALAEALTFDCDEISVETFEEYIDTTNYNVYSRQFQQLQQSVEVDTKEDLEARSNNEKHQFGNKNRKGADVPGRRNRVMLYLDRQDEESEYINAVYLNSFKVKDYFIVAQTPLPSTEADFICMIYQENCSCIVTTDDMIEPEETTGKYLPDEQRTLTFGNFTVSCSRLETKEQYIVRQMKIKFNGKSCCTTG